MISSRRWWILAAWWLTIGSCRGTADDGSANIHLYLAGSGWRASSDSRNKEGVSTAFYWADGVETQLAAASSDGAELASEANGVATLGTDVYVAGVEGGRACYWKNGAITYLEEGPSRASSIAISGTDIVIAGWAFNEEKARWACYWKNGERAPLPIAPETSGGTTVAIVPEESQAYAVSVFDNDVYAAGFYTYYDDLEPAPTYRAYLWHNGAGTRLEALGNATAFGVAADASGVHVVGYDEQDLCHWTNGAREVLLSSPGIGTASAVGTSNGDVHVTGWTSDPDLVDSGYHWKNGAMASLGNAVPNSLAFCGGDVLIGGYDSAGPCYWHNGRKTSLDIRWSIVSIAATPR
jgi:hypothetical protein